MKSYLKKRSFFIISLVLLLGTPTVFMLQSCGNEEVNQVLTELLVQALASWNQPDEQLDSIPQDVDIHDNTSGLPSSVDLTSKFPPIGDQGSYGTCVAWSSAYNLKTALNGIDKKWTATQLAQPQNQCSPKDLFWSIPSSAKGSDCNGTQFENAMDAMISRGVASLATVPYSNMGDCSQSPSSTWTTEANNNKLVNYRKIADQSNSASMTLNNFKSYLAEGRPVVIGARLGDRFMKWNSSAPIDYDTYNNPGMQHAYHAMVLGGYDDSKGAFRVINTWGNTWGNSGYIWVDYDFFISSFCFCGFVAQNKNTVSTNNGSVGTGNISTGLDVLAWNLTDADNASSSDPLDRQITYNVYNSGTETVKASDRWNILYMYYNAFDANDYGILIWDYYTDEVSTVPGDNGPWTGTPVGISANWWNYIDVPSGRSVAAALYNDNTADFQFSYHMPSSLNGKYYLVLVADGFDDLKEVNEDNNFFFYSQSNGKPFDIENGIIQESGKKKSAVAYKTPARFANTENQSLVSASNLNTYSSSEIMALIKHAKSTGDLQKKVNQYKRASANTNTKKKVSHG